MPKTETYPRCRTCGRDGSEAAKAREAALQLVAKAEGKAAQAQVQADALAEAIGKFLLPYQAGAAADLRGTLDEYRREGEG